MMNAMVHHTMTFRRLGTVMILLVALCGAAPIVQAACDTGTADGQALIERIRPVSGEGQGYRMAYCVDVPLRIYWLFKTDFRNVFLTDSPHIMSHRFIRRQGNVALTENRYSQHPERVFRWQTTVHEGDHHLAFRLLNPDQAGQAFHFGTIRLKARGRKTMVYQEARFQFAGAALWVLYPWRGGMRTFLQSFVNWEQQAALTWRSYYEARLKKTALNRARQRDVFPVNERYPDR